jgi:hypothetical protein
MECPSDLSQDSLGRPCCFGTLGTGLKAGGYHHPDVPLFLRLLQLLSVHVVVLLLVGVPHVHDFALGEVKLHPPPVCPVAQLVQCLLKLLSLFVSPHFLSQFRVISKLSQDADETCTKYAVKNLLRVLSMR